MRTTFPTDAGSCQCENCEPCPNGEHIQNGVSLNNCQHFAVAIQSDLDEGQAAWKSIVDLVRSCDLTNHDVFGIQLALEEAIINAVVHGNQSDPHKQVRIVCELTPHQFLVRIADEGHGFAQESIPDPRVPPYLSRAHGRGLLLMRNYMTTVVFQDGGRTVEMTKKLQPRIQPAPKIGCDCA